ncbi:major facilitator superfamily protein [Xylona heveae TC161]|uniref:Major facilitator superfamily protein n=1 Tax=Xylona heveae (strain CBS 132557 / TC161) TaxID=1328760 RepID=A0A164ZK92_XYLHT|nr:major facilitator superfamily protein [Xylona heveae TC161]KZF19197.1 major facilitator superfamily protein [Xylona heveae TC161]
MNYPTGWKFAAIIIAVYLAGFLVALDRTIIATAIPRITDHFHNLDDVGWYGSAYLLTFCSFQLLYGRIYTFYPPKLVFIVAIVIFEVGSAVCGAAPNSTAVIVGRALAGLGASGVFGGNIIIMFHTVPLQKRPIYTGLVGAVFGIASVVGPLLGGALTDNVSWRWCFYINLPIGGAAIVVIILILHLPPPKNQGASFREQINKMDPVGTLFFLPAIICLLLALQWGGSTYAWSNGRIIALLVVFGVLILAFVAVQVWKKDTATVPPRIIMQRSIAAGFFFSFCTGAAQMVLIYFLPIWFQAIKNVSAVKSGIMNLPLVIGMTIASLSSGFIITRIGYYTPFMIASTVLMSIGAALITTFQVDTRHPKWIGYQALWGIGCGMGMQQPGLAAQTVLSRMDFPTGASLMFFAQSLGGSVFISVGENLFASRLVKGVVKDVPGLDPGTVVNTGATDLQATVPSQDLDSLLHVYNHALTDAFKVALVATCVSVIGSLAMEWKNVKKVAKMQAQGQGQGPLGQGPPGQKPN